MKIATFGYLGWVVAVLAVTALGNCLAESRGVVMYQAPPGGYQGFAGVTPIYEGSHAVVIGIDAYQELPPLRGAVRDAQNVAKALRERGMQVTVLLNQEATRGQIARVLGDTLPYTLKPNERVVIYFAGHGVSVGEPPREMGYLMPIDGHREHVRSTGISMRELQNWLADYPSKHVLFVADACYSGLALTRSVGLSRRLPEYLKRILEKPVRIAMTAGGRNEEAHEWRGEGLFTHFFLSGVSGAADANVDGLVTSFELVEFVRENVTQTALTEFGAPQNPQLGRTGEGEFVFLTKGELGLQLNHVYRPGGKGPFKAFRSGAVLHSGDHYKIIFTPDRDSYVYLFQVDSAGQIFQLFPMRASKGVILHSANPVPQGRKVIVPGPKQSFVLDQQTGLERIFAIAAPEPDDKLESLVEELNVARRNQQDAVEVQSELAEYLTNRRGVRGIVADAERSVSWEDREPGAIFSVVEQRLEDVCPGCVHVVEFEHR